jgi:hypothetical protein
MSTTANALGFVEKVSHDGRGERRGCPWGYRLVIYIIIIAIVSVCSCAVSIALPFLGAFEKLDFGQSIRAYGSNPPVVAADFAIMFVWLALIIVFAASAATLAAIALTIRECHMWPQRASYHLSNNDSNHPMIQKGPQ